MTLPVMFTLGSSITSPAISNPSAPREADRQTKGERGRTPTRKKNTTSAFFSSKLPPERNCWIVRWDRMCAP